MTTKVTMPALGESVVEGTVGRWMIGEGDRVEKDQPIVEITTDKADTEVPSPVAGVVVKLLVGQDETVAVGGALCEIDESSAKATDANAAKSGGNGGAAGKGGAVTRGAAPGNGGAKEADQAAGTPSAREGGKGSEPKPASPSVRKLARERGVDLSEIEGSGHGGRITRDDVLGREFDEDGGEEATGRSRRESNVLPPPAPAAPARGEGSRPSARGEGSRPSAFQVPAYRPRPGDQIVPFSRRRRIIADHMVYSKHTSPDVVTMAECDLHATAKLREQHKTQHDGVGLSYLAFVAAATCRALREFPKINARVLDDALVLLGDIHLGVAVDTPEGLVVPVVQHADDLTVKGLARAIDELATRARDGKLKPDDLANKTFTLSNPGRRGNLVGGAIISQPNVAILRLGTIKKRVVVVEKDGDDLLAIRPVMHMALTYDHRVVDGVEANGFLYRVVEILEQGDFVV